MNTHIHSFTQSIHRDHGIADEMGDLIKIYKSAGRGAALTGRVAMGSGCIAVLALMVRQDSVGLMVCGLNAAIAVACLLYRRWELALRADLQRRGFCFYSGRNKKVFPYDEVAEVWDVPHYGHHPNGLPRTVPVAWRFDVVHQNGSRCRLAGLENVRELGDRIARIVAESRFEQAIEDLAAGETLTFGKLSVAGESVQYGKTAVSWKEIDFAEVNRRGEFVIHIFNESNPPIRLLVQHVANVRLLLKFINQAGRSEKVVTEQRGLRREG